LRKDPLDPQAPIMSVLMVKLRLLRGRYHGNSAHAWDE
jgi:hypothetical protein